MRWLGALALIAACSAPPERLPEPRRIAAPPDAAPSPPVTVADDDPRPTPCGDDSWGDCYSHGRLLVQKDLPDDIASGVVLLRALCEEGDRRRCFEPDTDPELQAACQRRQMVSACMRLSEMYDEGTLTCPYDTACATALHRMACLGGSGDPACP